MHTICSYNIAYEYFRIGTAIFLPISERQPAELHVRSFCQFLHKIGRYDNIP